MPRGPIRRAQLIAPFGTGALTVVRDGTSLIAGGLDFWYVRESGDSKSVDPSEYQIQEWRLQELLGVDHFRLPPDYRTARGVPGTSKTPNCWLTVPFLRFPRWHFCSRCNLLTEHPLALRGRVYCEECKLKDLKIPLAQVPFAAMCDHGHLQDFPWREWVHKTESPTCDKPLRLVATGGTTLAAQVVKCECGMNRPLARITEASPDGTTHLSTHLADENTPFLCRGLRPWLGTDERSPCDRHMRGTLRSASNIYFADVRSAIFLPRGDNSVPGELVEALGNPPLSTAIRVLTGTGIAVQPAQLRGLYRQYLEMYTDDQIASALLMIADGRKAPREGAPADGDDARTAFRRAEYATLQGGNDEQELMSRDVDLADYKEDIRRFFHRIVLVHKLRETAPLRDSPASFQRTTSLFLSRCRCSGGEGPHRESPGFLRTSCTVRGSSSSSMNPVSVSGRRSLAFRRGLLISPGTTRWPSSGERCGNARLSGASFSCTRWPTCS